MDIGIIGINFKTASVSEREAIAIAARACFGDDEIAPNWYQGVLLLTCNRIEFYFSADDLGFFHSRILNLLRSKMILPFEHQLYTYFGRDCFRHLAGVAAGFDSAIIAENEIQRQVKVAYDAACLHFDLPQPLHFLFQKSLKIAKSVRTLAPTLSPKVGLEQLVYGLWRDFFRGVNNQPILLVGNSQVNRHILAYFRRKKVEGITLCTRSVSAAEDCGVQVRDWSALKSWSDYRMIICASNTPEPILSIEEARMQQIDEKMLVLDLAMPRNVCPSLHRHPAIHLLNIDDLTKLLNHHEACKQKELDTYTKWIEQEVDKQVAIFRHKLERAAQYL